MLFGSPGRACRGRRRLLGGVAVATRCNGPARRCSTPGCWSGPAPAQLAAGRWEALPPMPATEPTRRLGPAVVWTGRQLIVWGGGTPAPTRALADGAAYDPATRRWTSCALRPVACSARRPRSGPAGSCWSGAAPAFPDPVGAPGLARRAAGVAYDPARRSWRLLHPASAAQGAHQRALDRLDRPGAAGRRPRGGRGGGRDRRRLRPERPTAGGDSPEPGAHPRPRPPAGPVGGVGRRPPAGHGLLGGLRPRPPPTSPASCPAGPRADGIDVWAYDPASDRWTVLPPPPAEAGGGQRLDDLDRAGPAPGGAAGRADGRQGPRDHRGRRRPRAGPVDHDAPRCPPQWRPAGPGQGRGDRRGAVPARRVRPGQRPLVTPAGTADPAGTNSAWNLERTLLWTVQRAAGAVQVYVLVPGRP